MNTQTHQFAGQPVSRLALVIGLRPSFWRDRQVLLAKASNTPLTLSPDCVIFPVILPKNVYMYTGVATTASGDGLFVVGEVYVRDFIQKFRLDAKKLKRNAKELTYPELFEVAAPFYQDDFAMLALSKR
jgi:hypothetical protein